MKKSGWNLYWVESDGYEDCFVAAKNRQSAEALERHENGFAVGEVKAHRIGSISEEFRNFYFSFPENKKYPWPWYVYGREILENFGADFRIIDGVEEMLLNWAVYEVDDYRPCSIRKVRVIGPPALADLEEQMQETGYEPMNFKSDIVPHFIEVLVGTLILRCQKIEAYLSGSFVFEIGSAPSKRSKTINEFINKWKKKTFGQMLNDIRKNYKIEETVDSALELHKDIRNIVAQRLYSDERYNIETKWGAMETITLLAFFDWLSQVSLEAAESAFYFSMALAEHEFDVLKESFISEEEMEKAGLFTTFFGSPL